MRDEIRCSDRLDGESPAGFVCRFRALRCTLTAIIGLFCLVNESGK
jgi:hypothetical protein